MHIFVSWGFFDSFMAEGGRFGRNENSLSEVGLCYNKVNVRVSRPGKFASTAVT